MDDAAGMDEEGRAAEAALRNLLVELGTRIRDVRKRQGIGQAECARGAAIDVSSMFRIEKGGQKLTVETLARIALSLGVPLDELVSGIEPESGLVAPRGRGSASGS